MKKLLYTLVTLLVFIIGFGFFINNAHAYGPYSNWSQCMADRMQRYSGLDILSKPGRDCLIATYNFRNYDDCISTRLKLTSGIDSGPRAIEYCRSYQNSGSSSSNTSNQGSAGGSGTFIWDPKGSYVDVTIPYGFWQWSITTPAPGEVGLHGNTRGGSQQMRLDKGGDYWYSESLRLHPANNGNIVFFVNLNSRDPQTGWTAAHWLIPDPRRKFTQVGSTGPGGAGAGGSSGSSGNVGYVPSGGSINQNFEYTPPSTITPDQLRTGLSEAADNSNRDAIRGYYTSCQRGTPSAAELDDYVEQVREGRTMNSVRSEICGVSETTTSAGRLTARCELSKTRLTTGERVEIDMKISGGVPPYNVTWSDSASSIPGFNLRSEGQTVRIDRAGNYLIGAVVSDSRNNSIIEMCPTILVTQDRQTTQTTTTTGERIYTQAELDQLLEMIELLRSLGIIGNNTNLNLNTTTTTSATTSTTPTTPAQSPVVSPNTGGPSSSFYRDLTLGSTGADVQSLQRYLNDNGYLVAESGPGSPGNETNYFGPATQRALSRFQFVNGIIPAEGHFGPATRNFVTTVVILNEF